MEDRRGCVRTCISRIAGSATHTQWLSIRISTFPAAIMRLSLKLRSARWVHAPPYYEIGPDACVPCLRMFPCSRLRSVSSHCAQSAPSPVQSQCTYRGYLGGRQLTSIRLSTAATARVQGRRAVVGVIALFVRSNIRTYHCWLASMSAVP